MSGSRRGGGRTPPPHGRVELHIDRLVLDGVSLHAGEVRHLQSALEQELGRLLTSVPGASWSPAGLANVRTPAISLPADAPGSAWGREIAQSVFTGLGAPHQPRAGRGDR